jgi:hypothetical protein
MTRAAHHLLCGQWSRALYFNWLVFPAFLIAALALTIAGGELLLRRRIVHAQFAFHLTAYRATAAFTLLFALWVLQVSLAIGGHKRELLNEHGPLYALLVR